MSTNRKRLCVHYLTYLRSGEKTVFLLSVRFFRVVLGVAVDIFGHARSFADRKKQPVIQTYIFAPVKKNGVLTRINISVMEIGRLKREPLNFGNRGLKILWDVWMPSVCLYAGSVTSGWITARPAVC